MALTSVVFTLVWFPLIGLAVSRLAGRMNVFLAGAGVNGLVLFVAGVLHVPLVPVLVCLGIASLLVVVLKRGSPLTWGKPVLADIVLGVAIVLLLAVSAVTPLTDFDGRAFWLLKGKAIAHELRVDGPFFHGQTTYDPRNEYPLLVPLDAATVMIATRELDERHVRWLYVLFAVALSLEVRRRVGPWYGALVLWLPRMMIADEGGALSAYADIALAAFVACAFFELAEENPGPLRLGLWLSFVALTKNEGLPFALVLLALGAIVLRSRVILAALPASVAVASLFLWRSRIEPTDDNRYFFAEIPGHMSRIGDVLINFGRHVLAFSDWGVFWIAVAVAGALLAWRRNWRPLLIAGAVIVPMVALYLVMYLASDWVTVDLVHATAPRLLIHFIGPAMYLVGYASQQDDRRHA